MEYTFDLKYLEGNKLKVRDTLSCLYIEEKHKISDLIPLNYLINNYHKAAGEKSCLHQKQYKTGELSCGLLN